MLLQLWRKENLTVVLPEESLQFLFRSALRIFSLLLLLLLSMSLPCRAAESPVVIDSLARENQILKTQLSRLEARRESFRWGRFPRSLVLLSGTVQQMQELPDGRLAFATDGQGAVFFNGTAFEVLDTRSSALADDFVTAVAPLPDGSLYLATASGIQLYRDGAVSQVPNLPPQLEGVPVTSLAAPDDSRLWLGTQGLGVWYNSPEGWTNWRAGSGASELSHDDISCLAFDSTSGTLWAGTAGGGACVLRDGNWQRFELPLGEGSEEIYCLTLDSEGRVWIGTVGAGAGYRDGTGWHVASLGIQPGSMAVSVTPLEGENLMLGTDEGSFILDRALNIRQPLPLPEEIAPYPLISATEAHSRLWLSPSGQGLYLFDRAVVSRYDTEQGLPDNNVYHITQSTDSRIWCATWNGVGIFDGRYWAHIGRRHGLPNDLATFVLFAGEDTTWFGTHGGVARLSKGGWDYFSRDNGLSSNTINHLALDVPGRLWISTEGGGLAVLEGDSLWAYRRSDGLPADEVQVTAPDIATNEVWVGTKRGLARISQGKVLPIEEDSRHSQPLPGPDHITSLRFSADGSLWAGTYGHGLWRLQPDKKWSQFTMENGLSSNEVLTIAESNDGLLYFGTSMGMTVFDGTHWRSYSNADGLYAGAINKILPSSKGALWLASEDHGIVRFDPARFEAPETYILAPSGRLLSRDSENSVVELLSEDNNQAGDSIVSPGSSRFVIEGSFYRGVPQGTGPDTLITDRLTLQCLGLTPWWPSPATGFRFSYRLDNSAWSEYSYQNVIDLYALSRGPHVVSVRAKGPHLKTDPTPAAFQFYVDMPTILSDWRLWGVIALLLLILAALIFRRQLAWHIGRLRHRHFKPISPNPFNPDQPTTEKECFFGRDEAIQAIADSFRGESAGNTAVIIQGDEKIGVSSLLLQTSEEIGSTGCTVVYLDLAGHFFPDVRELLSYLASRLEESGGHEVSGDNQEPMETLRSLLEIQDKPVAIILDNAEQLGRLLQSDTEHGPGMVSLFREAVLSERGASFIFGLHSLDTFRRQCDALFNMSRIMRLAAVSEESARMIIAEPLSGRAWFQEQALSLLVGLCHGQPFLAHYLGRELVELINREQTNLCTVMLAERAINALIENPPEELLDRWEELAKTEKLLLSAALSAAESPNTATSLSVSEVAGILESFHIGLIEEELAKAAASLADRGIISLQGSGGQFMVEDSLFSRWVAAGQPVEIVNAREEYDFGTMVHKTGEESHGSFNVSELAERLLKSLKTTLRFKWGALLIAGSDAKDESTVPLEPAAVIGTGAESSVLPVELSRRTVESLSITSTAIIVGETTGEPDNPAPEIPFEHGTILVPLLSRGKLLGLLALGERPGGQRYSRRDRLLLETICEQASVSIENTGLYEVETEKQRMEQELDTARHMQMSILPERNFEIPQLDFAAYLTPATEVGGDYFDYRLIDDGQFMFIIGDVSGHGISASTLVSMSKSLIYNQVKTSYEVDKVMDAMNDMVHGALAERLLMTLCYTVFDLNSRKVRYSIAGHPFPYHYRSNTDELAELELSAYPLGVTSKAKYAIAEFSYEPGDVLVFYSDGIVEGANPQGEQLGFERFEAMILKNKLLSPEEINRNIMQEFHQFAEGQPPDDDITLVVIKAK
jgi:serine phosphatase RsbU (regulator of sigma subunit)/ligand-binding sensor domain-containing protein